MRIFHQGIKVEIHRKFNICLVQIATVEIFVSLVEERNRTDHDSKFAPLFVAHIQMEDSNICALRIYAHHSTQTPQSEPPSKRERKSETTKTRITQRIRNRPYLIKWCDEGSFSMCVRSNGCYNEINLIVWCVTTDCVCCRFRLFSSPPSSSSINSFFRSELNILLLPKMHVHNFPCHAIGLFSISISLFVFFSMPPWHPHCSNTFQKLN